MYHRCSTKEETSHCTIDLLDTLGQRFVTANYEYAKVLTYFLLTWRSTKAQKRRSTLVLQRLLEKRWQRRWFVLYDDGELTYSVDEHNKTEMRLLNVSDKILSSLLVSQSDSKITESSTVNGDMWTPVSIIQVFNLLACNLSLSKEYFKLN
ncbi:hypothetical protein M0804_001018 [Polistes exclamans]|nr:hypothetical protein M0804_001018 [Polistes exclamans]